MICEICQQEYEPKAIKPIPMKIKGSEEIHPVKKATFGGGKALNLCQHCLAMTIYIESKLFSLHALYYSEPELRIAFKEES